MEINLTHSTAITMAKRLRTEVGPDVMATSASQEVLARVLGYANWDTLSGMLKREKDRAAAAAEAAGQKENEFLVRAQRYRYRQTPPQAFKPFTLFIEAYAVDEWAEGPSWFKLEVTPELVERLHKLQTLVLKEGLNVDTETYDGEWSGPDYLCLQGDALCVHPERFWFYARPEHGDYLVETRFVAFNELFELIDKGEQANSAYFAWCDGVLFRDSNSAKNLAESIYEEGDVALDEDKLDAMSSR